MVDIGKIRRVLHYAKENKKIVRTATVIVIIIVAVFFFSEKGKSENIIVESDATDKLVAEETQSEVKKEFYIDISGEVNNPGVYKVSSTARIFQVIEKAGGLKSSADLDGFNQAEVVTDGQKIIIPAKVITGENETENENETSAGQVRGKININKAASDELQEIPGVGPATADKIIDYRNTNGRFSKAEDIKNVDGIGNKTYEKIKNKITV